MIKILLATAFMVLAVGSIYGAVHPITQIPCGRGSKEMCLSMPKLGTPAYDEYLATLTKEEMKGDFISEIASIGGMIFLFGLPIWFYLLQ